MNRRSFLTTASAGAALALTAPRYLGAAEGKFEVMRTPEEWKAMLNDLEYQVMRQEATERPFSSPLNAEKSEGTYHCKGCDLALYPSDTKFKSGTGWPSFWKPLASDVIGTKTDRKLFVARTECHCSRCGSHLGHIFEDGPPPTGKRHCLNGVSLVFKAA